MPLVQLLDAPSLEHLGHCGILECLLPWEADQLHSVADSGLLARTGLIIYFPLSVAEIEIL